MCVCLIFLFIGEVSFENHEAKSCSARIQVLRVYKELVRRTFVVSRDADEYSLTGFKMCESSADKMFASFPRCFINCSLLLARDVL